MRPLHDLNPVRLAYVERSGALAGRAVVDVGCGGGLLAEAMAAKGARVVGLDLADDLLSVARLHALECGRPASTTGWSPPRRMRPTMPVVTTSSPAWKCSSTCPDPGAVVAALAALVRPGGDVFVSTLNRTPRAYLMAILGAEYVLRLLPTGTHTYEKFIRPSELAAWARDAGLARIDIAGLDYDPFSRKARLTDDAGVNYLMHFPPLTRRRRSLECTHRTAARPRRHVARHGPRHGRRAQPAACRARPRSAAVRPPSGRSCRTARCGWCRSAFPTPLATCSRRCACASCSCTRPTSRSAPGCSRASTRCWTTSKLAAFRGAS